jgi:hypothetical protein
MGAEQLYHNEQPAMVSLNDNHDTIVVRLRIFNPTPPDPNDPHHEPDDKFIGNYVVIGKVVIHNSDGSAQPGAARLAIGENPHLPFGQIDRSDFRFD